MDEKQIEAMRERRVPVPNTRLHVLITPSFLMDVPDEDGSPRVGSVAWRFEELVTFGSGHGAVTKWEPKIEGSLKHTGCCQWKTAADPTNPDAFVWHTDTFEDAIEILPRCFDALWDACFDAENGVMAWAADT